METRPWVRVSALASGSSGNAFLLEAEGVEILFDAGLNAGVLEYYMRQRGISPVRLAAIFVSHEHTDHLRGAGTLARRYKLPIVATQGTFSAGIWQFGSIPEKIVQAPGSEVRVGARDGAPDVPDVVVRTFTVSHDATEPTGFWIEAAGRHIAICTDLGCETDSIHEALKASDLLVLEANHDMQKLWRGHYPYSLKKRVAGPHGHLANADTARLVAGLAQDGKPRTVWLAHLSAANNTPALAFDTVIEPLDREECTHLNIAVLARDKPSHVWEVGLPAGDVEADLSGVRAL